jgi:uncharacterized protein YdgA (DUF945 family)
VKRSILCAAVAALALAGASAIAEDVPAKPAGAPERSKMWDALVAMGQDFEDLMEGKGNPVARLDGMAAARPAPAPAAAVSAVFGTDRPYTVARVPAPKGQAGFQARVQPVAYLDPNGSRIEWAALDALLTLDASGRSMTIKGSWPSLVAEDADIRLTARDISFAGDQKRGFADLWFGTFQVRIPHLRVEARTENGLDLALADTSIVCSIVQRGKLADINYKVSSSAIGAAGEQAGGFSLAARVVNLDAKAMAEVSDKLRKESKGKTFEQREADSLPILKEFLRQSATRGSAVIIDELRASYHGNTATLKGRIGVEGRGTIAIDASLFKRILARFTVRVPVPMIQDVAAATARKQMAASAPGQPVSEQAVAQMAQTITDTVVGQALAKGFARIDNGYLESNLEFRNGILRVNGKEVALPNIGPAPAAAPATPAALSPTGAGAARMQ